MLIFLLQNADEHLVFKVLKTGQEGPLEKYTTISRELDDFECFPHLTPLSERSSS